MASKDCRVNRQIRSYEVFLIDEKGEKKGRMSFNEAIAYAEDLGLDLVEVSPNANPPVCKVLDYGKYRYEMEKKQREAKKKQFTIKIKEIRMQVKVDVGDLKTKVRFITEFLDKGNKVKVSVRFRGREMQHIEIGRDVLSKVIALLDENSVGYVVEQAPSMEGRMIGMLLAPSKAKSKTKDIQTEKNDST